MQQTYALDIARQAMQVSIMILLPILSVALFVGVLVSVFQALTQVQEMTLTFVPKMIGVGLVMTIMGSWMISTLVSFTVLCFHQIGRVGAG